MLIAFEGVDGAGKGTQSKAYADRLGEAARLFTFPAYDTPMGRIVKRYLHGEFGDLDATLAANLYSLDRAQFRDQLHAWSFKNVAVCDRYAASNLAFQAARSEDPDALAAHVNQVEYVLLGLPRPTVTVLLDIPVGTALARIVARGRAVDIHERGDFLEKVVEAYRRLAANSPDWVVVDGTQDVDAVTEEVRAKVDEATRLAA